MEYLSQIPEQFLDYVNWEKISNTRMDEAELLKYYPRMNASLACKNQIITPTVVNMYKDMLDYNTLSYNSDLPADTIKMVFDKLDLETSQMHHKYNDELIDLLGEAINTDILFRYQQLSESTIMKILANGIKNNDIDTILINQVVSQDFIEHIKSLETPEKKYFTRQFMFKQESLSPEYCLEHVENMEDAVILLKNKKLNSDQILKLLSTYPEMDISNVIAYQKLEYHVIKYLVEKHPTIIQIIAQRQTFPFDLIPENNTDLYNNMYVGYTQGHSDYTEEQLQMITSKITPEIVNIYIPNVLMFLKDYRKRNLPDLKWYTAIRSVTKELIDYLLENPILTVLELWNLMYAHDGVNRHWWKEFKDVDMLLEILKNEDQALLIKRYVIVTDWTKILNNEILPEWAILVFGEFANYITTKMNNINYWWKITRYQKLSHQFIRNNLDKLDINILPEYQDVPDDVMEKIKEFAITD